MVVGPNAVAGQSAAAGRGGVIQIVLVVRVVEQASIRVVRIGFPNAVRVSIRVVRIVAPNAVRVSIRVVRIVAPNVARVSIRAVRDEAADVPALVAFPVAAA